MGKLKGINMCKFLFGDIVVFNNNEIGVVVKSWETVFMLNINGTGEKPIRGNTHYYEYEVYNRMSGKIETYTEDEIKRYRVRHKYLNEEEMGYQNE